MALRKYSFRGIVDGESFARKFEAVGFSDFYQRHKDELIIGVREGFINLYYNCYRFSKIEERRKDPLMGIINSNHFIQDKISKGKEIKVSATELEEHYELLKTISDEANLFDGSKALSTLFIENNRNSQSQWACIDLVYEKSSIDEDGKRKTENWKFDVIAISKTKPYRVAFIALKYGTRAFVNEKAIRDQIKAFHSFSKESIYEGQTGFELILPELCSIAHTLSILGAEGVPQSFKEISPEEFNPQPEFYIISLDDTRNKEGESHLKQKLGSLLFKDNRWGGKKFSKYIATEGDYFDLIQHDPDFKLTFLFSESNLAAFKIKDIIDDNDYIREIVSLNP